MRLMLSLCIGGMLCAGSAQASCALPEESAALNSRVLQTELMVAALSCGNREQYNDFVQRFHHVLKDHGDALRGYFMRTYGDEGEGELNAFITRLANQASNRSLERSEIEFCQKAAMIFHDVLEQLPWEYASYTTDYQFADAHGIERCDQYYTLR